MVSFFYASRLSPRRVTYLSSHCHLLTETFEKSQLFTIFPFTLTPFYATLFKSFKIVYVTIGINYGEIEL